MSKKVTSRQFLRIRLPTRVSESKELQPPLSLCPCLPSAANGPCVEWLGVEHLAVERGGG